MTNKLLSSLLVAASLLALTTTTALAADVPTVLTQQGRLVDQDGKPVTGALSITFSIYADAAGGTALWTETQTVKLDEGYFVVQLGAAKPLPLDLFEGDVRHLGITIEDDTEMSPREALTSVPYALVSRDVRGDIHPRSVSIGDTKVIDDKGNWVGATAGLAGPKGDTGPAGPKGEAGPKGDTGAQGVPGAPGATGPQGTQGAKGDAGPQGVPGSQGVPGAQGPQGPKGDTGAQGPQGVQGAQGPSGQGIVATAAISGTVSAIAANPSAYTFVGPTATVTTTATQRINAVAQTPLGLTSGTILAYYAICYQPSAGGSIYSLGATYTLGTFTSARTPFSAAASYVLGAGTWKVGFCVGSNSSAINTTDYVSGWVEVVSN